MTATTVGAEHGADRAPWWTWRRQFRQQLQPRLAPLLALFGCCWLLVIGMTVLDGGHAHGHAGPQQQLILDHAGPAALLTVALSWQLMTLAMMGPSCLPAARHVAMNTLSPARTVPAFLLGYLLLWSGYLAAIAVGGVGLHQVVGTDAGAASAVLPAAVLLVAAAWQLTPIKRACLRHCRSGRVLPARGRRADLGALRFGARHGLACVGSCGPMMLIMFTVTSWHLLVMAALGWLIWLEKTRWVGRRLAVPSAAGLAVLSVMLPVLSA